MTDLRYPTVVLLGMPHALSRSMAHALLRAWEQGASKGSQNAWQCLASQASEAWPQEALVYVLGQDWRDSDPADPTIARQISAWREQLDAEQRPYVMLYGKPSAQWLQLAESLKSVAPDADWNWISAQNPWKPSARMRLKGCEQCDDPECEQALFAQLKKAS